MNTYVVILEITRRGAVLGTTRDEIEAESVLDAEAQAIAGWTAVAPGRTYRPLLTTTKTEEV